VQEPSARSCDGTELSDLLSAATPHSPVTASPGPVRGSGETPSRWHRRITRYPNPLHTSAAVDADPVRPAGPSPSRGDRRCAFPRTLR
jgi:hypothetical protein